MSAARDEPRVSDPPPALFLRPRALSRPRPRGTHIAPRRPVIHRDLWPTAPHRTLAYACLAYAALGLACVNGQRGTDTSNPGVPGGPTAPTGHTVAYTDLQAAFTNDCLNCHNDFHAAGNYSMGSLSAVLKDVRPFDAASLLVVDTQPGGSMYRYWTGDPQAKAALVFNWVVIYGAPPSQ
jgi:hypothetical protein